MFACREYAMRLARFLARTCRAARSTSSWSCA